MLSFQPYQNERATMSSVTSQASGAKFSDVIKIEEEKIRSHVDGVVRESVEETVVLRFAGHEITGVPELDVDRTSVEGKASAVQFVHFAFSAEQIAAFRAPGAEVIVGFRHPHYGHMAVMPETTRAALAADFD